MPKKSVPKEAALRPPKPNASPVRKPKSAPRPTSPRNQVAARDAEKGSPAACELCKVSLVPLKSGVFVARPCKECGKETFLYDRDPKNSGLRIQEGDRVTISAEFLNRLWLLVGGGRLTRDGLNMLARGLFFPSEDLIREPAQHLMPILKAWEDDALAFITESGVFAGLDLETDDGQRAMVERLKADDVKAGPVPWASLTAHIAVPHVREAIEAGDPVTAAGAAIIAASARAMLMYKVRLEEVVWRGHSVEALRTALEEWENNRQNDNEEFWQQMLSRHNFVLSQALAAPAFVLGGKAYVGGKSVDNTGGSVSDFLVRNKLTHHTTVIEIKVPTAPLLTGSEYRNRVYPPSAELAGAVSQAMSQAAALAENPSLRLDSKTEYDPARSGCVVIIGSTSELADNDRRRSFDLYRSELRTVRVVTYDELFAQVATLLTLFGGQNSAGGS